MFINMLKKKSSIVYGKGSWFGGIEFLFKMVYCF